MFGRYQQLGPILKLYGSEALIAGYESAEDLFVCTDEILLSPCFLCCHCQKVDTLSVLTWVHCCSYVT